jgi:hypothetical protein
MTKSAGGVRIIPTPTGLRRRLQVFLVNAQSSGFCPMTLSLNYTPPFTPNTWTNSALRIATPTSHEGRREQSPLSPFYLHSPKAPRHSRTLLRTSRFIGTMSTPSAASIPSPLFDTIRRPQPRVDPIARTVPFIGLSSFGHKV